MRSLLLLLLSGMMIATCSDQGKALRGSPPARGLTEPWQTVANSAHLLRMLNAYRAGFDLPPLELSATASAAARLQAGYNLRNHSHGHDNQQYPEPADRLRAVGHQYQANHQLISYSREVCIQVRQLPAIHLPELDTLIMESYQRSAAHNEALLDANVRSVGIATLYDGWEMQNTMVLCI